MEEDRPWGWCIRAALLGGPRWQKLIEFRVQLVHRVERFPLEGTRPLEYLPIWPQPLVHDPLGAGQDGTGAMSGANVTVAAAQEVVPEDGRPGDWPHDGARLREDCRPTSRHGRQLNEGTWTRLECLQRSLINCSENGYSSALIASTYQTPSTTWRFYVRNELDCWIVGLSHGAIWVQNRPRSTLRPPHLSVTFYLHKSLWSIIAT